MRVKTCQPKKFGVNNDIDVESPASNEIEGCDDDEMDGG